MKTITVIEHTKISPGFRGLNNECPAINDKQFKELHNFALTERGKAVLVPGHGCVKTTSHVGVIQTKSGLVLEILPKIYKESAGAEGSAAIRSDFLKMLRTMRHLPKYKQIDFANLKTSRMPI